MMRIRLCDSSHPLLRSDPLSIMPLGFRNQRQWSFFLRLKIEWRASGLLGIEAEDPYE